MTARDRYRVAYVPAGGDYTDPLARLCRLYLFEKIYEPDGETRVIYGPGGPSGSSKSVVVHTDPSEAYPAASLSFPPEFALPMLQAIQDQVINPEPPDTSVLRAQLLIEQKRVDDQLRYFMTGSYYESRPKAESHG